MSKSKAELIYGDSDADVNWLREVVYRFLRKPKPKPKKKDIGDQK